MRIFPDIPLAELQGAFACMLVWASIYCASLGSLQMGQFHSPKQCLSQMTLLQEENSMLYKEIHSKCIGPCTPSKGSLEMKMFVRVVIDCLHLIDFVRRATFRHDFHKLIIVLSKDKLYLRRISSAPFCISKYVCKLVCRLRILDPRFKT